MTWHTASTALLLAACLLCAVAASGASQKATPSRVQQAKGNTAVKSTPRAAVKPAARKPSALQPRQLRLKLPADKDLRIWCVGDSITEGWVGSSSSFHPYTIALNNQLSSRLPSGWRASFVNSGIGGGGIQDKVGEAVRGMAAQPFDVAIVMAGINDVKWRLRQADSVFETLKQLYSDIWAKTGAVVLAVPPLPTKLCGYNGAWGCDIEAQRRLLREKIVAYVAAQQRQAAQEGVRPKIVLLDMETPFQYWQLPAGTRDTYFDDDVHLSPLGYDKLGQAMAQQFCKIYPDLAC